MSDKTDQNNTATPTENPAAETPATGEATTENAATEKAAPAGTTIPGALFDMAPTKPEPKPAARQGAPAKTSPSPEPKKYPEGTEVRYGREKVQLPREMSAKEVLDWMSEDDYPELRYEESELRYDKEKNRLVVVRKAQKKGKE